MILKMYIANIRLSLLIPNLFLSILFFSFVDGDNDTAGNDECDAKPG